MKKGSTIEAFAIFLGITLMSLPGFGQLIIEGGPNGVGMSNRDGRIEVPAPSSYGETIIYGNTVTGPLTPGIQTNSTFRGVEPVVTLPARNRPAASVPRTGPADPYGNAVVHVIDVKKIQQLAKLERELGVIKTNQTAWMAFEADKLFGSREASLGKSSRAMLDKVIAYLALSGGKGISVSYDYMPGSDSPGTGMARASSVVDYLMDKTGLSPGWFSIPQPEPVKKLAIDKEAYPGDQRSISYASVVNIRIER